MDDEELVRAFEAGHLPVGGFGHAQHVRVAWWHVRQYTLPEALDRFRSGLQRFAAAQGAPERYHETITTAYVLLIAGRLDPKGRARPWEAFAAENGDLLSWSPSILECYYTRETLWSEAARHSFVMPDREVGDRIRAQLVRSGQVTRAAVLPASFTT